MKSFIHVLLLALFLSSGMKSALAHHTASGPASISTGSGTSVLSLQSGVNASQPRSRVFLSTVFSHLDGSLGQIVTGLVGGEYSINSYLSVLGALPITHLAHNLRNEETGLGDLILQGKVRLWDKEKTFFFLTSGWSLPTGDEDRLLGRGAVAQELNIFFGGRLKKWLFFASPGIQFGYESQAEPVFLMTAGVTTPGVWKDRVRFTLGLNSPVFLDSDVFESGSAKVYVEPGVMMRLDSKEKWTLSLQGRVSLIDTLSRKAGVTLTGTDHSLLTDILAGGTIGIEYQFK